jgi:hypothetical protein
MGGGVYVVEKSGSWLKVKRAEWCFVYVMLLP